MTDIINASLVLKTTDCTSNSDYIVPGLASVRGNCVTNAKLSSITWNNINLRTLLGKMYDDYDLFNLCLNTISTSQANNIDTNADSKNVTVRISGLPFVNQTYNCKNGFNSALTTIGTFNFVSSGATTQYYYSNNIATFGKNQEICNITIEYARISDDSVVNSVQYGTDITSLTGTASSGSNTITLSASNASITIGSKISATGIPSNTFITSYDSTTKVITISQSTTQSLSSTSLTIGPLAGTYPHTIFIFDIVGIPKDNNKNGQRLLN